jgi:ketosteroid isomerase-like protein
MRVHLSNNEELIQRIYAAFASGDMAALAGLYTDEVVLHVPGLAPAGAIFTGKGEVFTWYATLFERSAKTFWIQPQAIFAWDAQVVTFYRAGAEYAGKHYEWQGVEIYTLAVSKVIEIWSIVPGRARFQTFWGESASND